MIGLLERKTLNFSILAGNWLFLSAIPSTNVYPIYSELNIPPTVNYFLVLQLPNSF